MGRLTAVIVAALLLLWFLTPSRKPEQPMIRQAQACPVRKQAVIRATPKPVGSLFEREVIQLTNRERARRGLQPLKPVPTMMADARSWSQNQANRSRMYHSRMGYGENVAYGQRDPEEVMNAWMNSRGHRANILNPRYSTIGVGAVSNGRSLYWTQVFR